MKSNFFLFVSVMLISLKINSQENALSMRILNKGIIANRDQLIEVEIENLSEETILIPLSTKSLNSYEYMNGYEKIITESGSVNQILIGLRIIDSTGSFLIQVPSKGSAMSLSHSNEMFGEVEDQTNEFKQKQLEKLYRINGFNDEPAKILEYEYLRENLLIIEPKSKIKINYVLNLRKFSIHTFEEVSSISSFEGGFEIKEEGCVIYLELDLEKSFLNPYYIKLRKNKIINPNGHIFYGKLLSNKIPIHVD